MIGIDLIPAQPPRGVATFQGDFLSPMVQKLVKDFIARTRSQEGPLPKDSLGSDEPALDQLSYIDRERHASEEIEGDAAASSVDVSGICFLSTLFISHRIPILFCMRDLRGGSAIFFRILLLRYLVMMGEKELLTSSRSS